MSTERVWMNLVFLLSQSDYSSQTGSLMRIPMTEASARQLDLTSILNLRPHKRGVTALPSRLLYSFKVTTICCLNIF